MSSHSHNTGTFNPELENYIEAYTTSEDELLYELRRQTYLKVLRPRMISGPVQGQLLTMFCRMIKPGSVLEIGTFTGYASICMARGMEAGTYLYTIERDDELETFIKHYFDRADPEGKIHLHIGDALQIINELDVTFDLVFIDGDKRQYPQYYETVMPKLRPGGYILADNILWNGKVVDPDASDDEFTQGILRFNRMVKDDPRTTQVILPVRDGLMMVRKNASDRLG